MRIYLPFGENFTKETVSKDFFGTFASKSGFHFVKPDSVELWLLGNEDSFLVTADGRTLVWELPYSPETPPAGEAFLLNLTRTTTISPGMTGFALIPPVPEATFFGNIRFLQASEMIFINSWLTQPLNAPDGSVHRYALVAFRVKNERHFPKEAPIFCSAIEK